RIQLIAETLLRAHIKRAADEIPGAGQILSAWSFGSQLGDAEIDYANHIVTSVVHRQQQVARFDIAVDHPAPMSMMNGISGLGENVEESFDRQRPLRANKFLQTYAFN